MLTFTQQHRPTLYINEIAGYLPGIEEVCPQMSFTYTGKATTFNCSVGIKISLPDDALPPGAKECEITVKSSISGQFEFPKDTKLVSAVYWIHSSHNFLRPITIELQHCAPMDGNQLLSFVTANCPNEHLPYKFRLLSGGVFSPYSSYGCIQVSHFSLFAIILRKLGVSQVCRTYCAGFYYQADREATMWKVDFTIVWNLELHMKVSALCIDLQRF